MDGADAPGIFLYTDSERVWKNAAAKAAGDHGWRHGIGAGDGKDGKAGAGLVPEYQNHYAGGFAGGGGVSERVRKMCQKFSKNCWQFSFHIVEY